MYVEYSSNNSGGRWWLTDEDYRALEQAGWKVNWVNEDPSMARWLDTDGRYLGCLAKSATKPNCSSLREAADEWERVTGQNATDAGCPCCGHPRQPPMSTP